MGPESKAFHASGRFLRPNGISTVTVTPIRRGGDDAVVTVVPIHPSEAMIQAGVLALLDHDEKFFSCDEQMQAIWAAMLRARSA